MCTLSTARVSEWRARMIEYFLDYFLALWIVVVLWIFVFALTLMDVVMYD